MVELYKNNRKNIIYVTKQSLGDKIHYTSLDYNAADVADSQFTSSPEITTSTPQFCVFLNLGTQTIDVGGYYKLVILAKSGSKTAYLQCKQLLHFGVVWQIITEGITPLIDTSLCVSSVDRHATHPATVWPNIG